MLVTLGTHGTTGTTLSVPVGLSALQYSTGTTCTVFGTTDSMCWYLSVPLVPLVPRSLCQWVSLHSSTLLVPHVQSLVPLTLFVGTSRYVVDHILHRSLYVCLFVYLPAFEPISWLRVYFGLSFISLIVMQMNQIQMDQSVSSSR